MCIYYFLYLKKGSDKSNSGNVLKDLLDQSSCVIYNREFFCVCLWNQEGDKQMKTIMITLCFLSFCFCPTRTGFNNIWVAADARSTMRGG